MTNEDQYKPLRGFRPIEFKRFYKIVLHIGISISNYLKVTNLL